MKIDRIILKTLLLLVFMMASQSWAEGGKVLFVSGSHSNKAKVALIKKIAHEQSLIIDRKSAKDLEDLNTAKTFFATYDLVLFDESSQRSSVKSFLKYSSIIKSLNIKSLALKWSNSKELSKGLTKVQSDMLVNYYGNGGEENFSRMVQYLQHRVLYPSKLQVLAPIVFPKTGIYHPEYDNLIFSSLEGYQEWKQSLTPKSEEEDERTVGLMLQRSLIESAQTTVVDATIKILEARGVHVIPFYFELSPMVTDYSPLIQKEGKTLVDTIINFRSIHWANKRKVEFEALGVPVIQALTYSDGNQQDWEASTQGISAGMMAFTLVLPETAGVVDPMIVAAVNQKTHSTEVIDYQLDHLIDRALAYASLVKKQNSDKKLTVMFWGDRDMGASFLNVPESLRAITSALNEEGYKVSALGSNYFTDRVNKILDPFYREYQLKSLLKDDLAALLPVSEYRQWLNTLPENVIKDITRFWGQPEANFMVIEQEDNQYFVIPRIRNGNVLVMRQPPRSDQADNAQTLFHTTTTPINHYYLAAYYYARESWGSDAFIHLGTHGSHEYLPTKERGLSRYDGGNLAVGAVPVMYPFIVDNVGEAMQTKRRGNAVVVSHMTPPFASAGLQGVTADIHRLMHQYNLLDDGGVKKKTGDEIAQLCLSKNLCEDFGFTLERINSDFDAFVIKLHDYLGELASENQPLGLHTFGELAEERLITSTLVQMLGSDYISLAGDFEAEFYKGDIHSHKGADEHGHSKEHDHGKDHDKDHGHTHTHHLQDETSVLEDLAGFKLIRDFVLAEKEVEGLPKEIIVFINKGREYYKNMKGMSEIKHLLAGLSGEYIPVKTGGDPIRNPESLPTGYNLYGFDPTRLPTKAAFEQGKELVTDVIDNFYKDHGRYPAKLALSLWSIEAMRHYGVLESQALYAMGVEPVWSDDGRVIDTKIIPSSELKRPRVDVVLSATGLYRDTFPNVMQRLAAAIKQVAELKEEGNFLWNNSQRIEKDLVAEGVFEDEAQYLSTVRIFSNTAGDYGSGVNTPIFESESWEEDSPIADTYLSKMGYYFGSDSSRWGKEVKGLYSKQLSGTDVALFSRSSNLYGMITSDDPFEYFGSLALAVRHLDGASPEMQISNLRNISGAKMEKASTLMAKELRSRNFNRRWIEQMQKEGYSGAVVIASSLNNFWGWQVVDPNVVRNDQWNTFYEVYVEDKYDLNMDEWFERVNPKSQAQMIERMLEATRKEYWPTDPRIQKKLIERYQELVNKYDLPVDNEKLRAFMNEKGVGFGLELALPAPEAAATAVSATPVATKQVYGQELQEVEQVLEEGEKHWTLWWLFAGGLVLFLSGVMVQSLRGKSVLKING